MPRKFYADTVQPNEQTDGNANDLCLAQVTLFDGPGVCTRKKNHKLDNDLNPETADPSAEFHQEGLEGWVWNDAGLCD